MDLFADTIDRLALEDQMREDIILPLSEFHMRDSGELFHDDYGELELGKEAFGHLSKIFRLNQSHLQLLMNEGLSDNVAYQFNHFLDRTSQRKKFRIVEGKVKGIVSPNFSTYDDFQLFSTLGDIREVMPEMRLSNFHRDDKRTHARFLMEGMDRVVGFDTEEDGNPDVIQLGFDVQNSEIGYGRLQIAPLTYRLVCTNGMRRVVPDTAIINQRHSNFSNFDIDRGIREGIDLSVKESTETVTIFQRSKDMKIDDPIKEIERIGKEEKINQKEISRIQEMFDIEPQENMFGVINSFTRYGRDLELENQDNERRVGFEDIAGRLLERVR